MMATYPKISIVTTNYNYGRFLEETIRSVVLQNYPNLEYIIIDGGSTDNSVDIIRNYESHLADWISEPDSGQANGINKGFRKCTGDIVAFLNSDDFYKPETLHTVGDIFSKHPDVNWIGGPIDIVDEHSRYLKTAPVSPFRQTINWIEGLWFPQPSSFWRREVIDRVGLLDETLYYCFDQEYWARLICAGYQPLIWETSLSVEREHSSRKTFKFDEKWLLERLYIAQKYISKLSPKDCNQLRKTIRYFERRLLRSPIYHQALSDQRKATGMLLPSVFYHPDLLKDRETWGLIKSLMMPAFK